MLAKSVELRDLGQTYVKVLDVIQEGFLERQVYIPPLVKVFEQSELTQGGDNGPLESNNGAFNS